VTASTIVIGAGPAGLAAAHELGRRGIEPRILDAGARVGEPWRRRHDALRLNTHRITSGLPGLRIPRSAGAYPSRDAFVAYLEAYERFLGIDVEYGVRVERIDASAGGRWAVVTAGGESPAADVVVATGPDSVPFTPSWPGMHDFTGELLHASQFRRPGDYDGRTVLIVGGGNSAVDLGNALTRSRPAGVFVSVRNAATIVPKCLAGVPLQPIAVLSRAMPRWYQDGATRVLGRIAFGDLGRVGLAEPPKGPLTRFLQDGVAPAIDDGFVAALEGGRFRIVAEIARFERESVLLADGERLRPDVVICATGYRTGLEPLVGHLGVLDRRGRPRFVGGEGSPACPGLWFVGQRSNFHGNLHARTLEARALAKALVARRKAETRMVVNSAARELAGGTT